MDVDSSRALKDGLDATEIETWAWHFDDVADAARGIPGAQLSRERARWLRGLRDNPQGNISNFQ